MNPCRWAYVELAAKQATKLRRDTNGDSIVVGGKTTIAFCISNPHRTESLVHIFNLCQWQMINLPR